MKYCLDGSSYSFLTLCILFRIGSFSSTSRHHLLARERAINNHTPSGLRQRYSTSQRSSFRPQIVDISVSRIDQTYFNPVVLSTFGNDTCMDNIEPPGILNEALHTCPYYVVVEYDNYRIPATLSQVRCRCLDCRGPIGNNIDRRCTPLFRFTLVYRVVNIAADGSYQYTQVWEPQSFDCKCSTWNRRRYVMPP